MTSRLVALAVAAQDPPRLARFWADLLGLEVADDGVTLRPGEAVRFGLTFEPTETPPGPSRIHLHLTSATPADQQATVARVLELGGSHLDVGQRPDEGHVVLADPEGVELCVIEAGNSFLAGCGFLGELACDGTRQVGYFWSAALGWPLVWDQDEETAIQSPEGGTKIAWGGPPVVPKTGRDRLHLDLAPDGDPEAEVARLVSLGATRTDGGGRGRVELLDPDGNEFCLLVAR